MRDAIFIVDIPSCVGCYTCSIACKDRAGLPDDLDILKVNQVEEGIYPETGLYYRVNHCFHCFDPPCAAACYKKAIVKDDDGLVKIVRAKCIGCGKCIKACPFNAIVMLPEGTAHKCDACADETSQGLPPTCVRACPMRALKYEPVKRPLPADRIPDLDFDDQDIGPAVLYLQRNVKTK